MIDLEDYLIERGLDDLVASNWVVFLRAVFEALAQAERMVREPAYWDEHVAKEGALLKRSILVDRVRRRICSEEGLTHAISYNLFLFKCSSPPGHPLRSLEIEFHSEAKQHSSALVGPKAKRTDILARSSSSTNAPSMIIEAKLVIAEKDFDRDYLGSKGMKRFTRAIEPYASRPFGTMLAYTVQKQPPVPFFEFVAGRLAETVAGDFISFGEGISPILASAEALTNPKTPGHVHIFHTEMIFATAAQI